MRVFVFLLFSIFCEAYTHAQDSTVVQKVILKNDSLIYSHKTTPDKKKIQIAAFTHGGVMVSTLAILNKYWYSKESRQKLSSFNDSKEWLQLDKVGHTFSTYLEARLSTSIWKWSGMEHQKTVLLGSGMALLYQTSFEIMDGTVATYGFSWSDVAANTVGASLFAFQELKWKEQRIQPKVSYTGQHYDPSIVQRAQQLYGKAGTERFLKDYNGQTHWWSVNLKSFAKRSKLPTWLNVAVGYGVQGMLGGFENKWKDALGNNIVRYDIPRYRQWYIAPDVDFTKIKTNKKGLKVLFYVLNLVKFPAPGLELSNGKVKLKGIVY
jgi:VanZ family protein